MRKTMRTLQRWRLRILFGLLLALSIAVGPAAHLLQVRTQWAGAAADTDIVYLVCGARAQQRRLQALQSWFDQHQPDDVRIWIGNDTQNSLWSRQHQRNLTRAEWAYAFVSQHFYQHGIAIVPGSFSNTDGEMQALGDALRDDETVHTVALVTCAFHARRTLQRFKQHAPDGIHVQIIPVVPHWENRAPWIVAAEWLKLIRDQLRLTQHPWLSRQ